MSPASCIALCRVLVLDSVGVSRRIRTNPLSVFGSRDSRSLVAALTARVSCCGNQSELYCDFDMSRLQFFWSGVLLVYLAEISARNDISLFWRPVVMFMVVGCVRAFLL